ncbi:hypothetical protein D9758_006905 [Tetrapyrgos nigripes]|uniref:Uncharacterized protein n=1 Tax=Tetrapyrgos nigripes TaxID=182062 RepID=A0A8H5GSF5_9AGAR|nr:hypothetical protein D9758_006905 [Tetrapyrgos nigripes]
MGTYSFVSGVSWSYTASCPLSSVMRSFPQALFLGFGGIFALQALAIKPADPSFVPPTLSHQPFGYGGRSTGGSLNTSSSSIFVVSNASELKDALALPFTKTIYVNGTIDGNELPDGE